MVYGFDCLTWLFDKFMNISIKKNYVGKALEALGLVYHLDTRGRVVVAVKFEKRQQLAADIGKFITAQGSLVVGFSVKMLQQVLGLANFILTSTKFVAGRHLYSNLYQLMESSQGSAMMKYRDDADPEDPRGGKVTSGLTREQTVQCLQNLQLLAYQAPPLDLDIAVWTLPRAHLYTDARNRTNVKHMGGVLFLPVVADENSSSEVKVYGFTEPVPKPIVEDANSRQKQPIATYEALAVAVGAETFSSLIAGRRVSFHADNKVAISCIMDGYARDSLFSSTVWQLHSTNVRSKVLGWFSYVNTKLNISDGMSRPEWVKDVQRMFPQLQLVDAKFPFAV